MAQAPQDREDLLRDATAFSVRLQLRVEIGGEPICVFAGFRANGAASVYLDQDPVYHFNASVQLRRAFVDGKLIKAERGQLITLDRQHEETAVALVRGMHSSEQQQQFCDDVLRRMIELREAIASGAYAVDGCVGDYESPMEQLAAFLSGLQEIQVADSPRVAD